MTDASDRMEQDQADIDDDGDDIVKQIKGSRRDLRAVGQLVVNLTGQVARSRLALGILSAALALSLIAGVLGGLALLQLRSQNACLRVVVSATADRTGVLAPAAAARTKADRAATVARDNLILLAITQAPRDQVMAAAKKFVVAKTADDVANDHYDSLAAANPPPTSPTKAC